MRSRWMTSTGRLVAVVHHRLVRFFMILVCVARRPLATLRRGSFYQSVAECDGRYYLDPLEARLPCGRSDHNGNQSPTCKFSHCSELHRSRSKKEPRHIEDNNTRDYSCRHHNYSPSAKPCRQKYPSCSLKTMADELHDKSKLQLPK